MALWDAVAKKPVAERPGARGYKALAFAPRGNLLAWGNVDARGKLYHDFLLIRFADSPELGDQAIPVQRLYFVQFGHGGIKEVAGQPQSQ